MHGYVQFLQENAKSAGVCSDPLQHVSRAIRSQFDICIDRLLSVVAENDMADSVELILTQSELRLRVQSLNIPPGKNPRIVVQLSETLVQTAESLLDL